MRPGLLPLLLFSSLSHGPSRRGGRSRSSRERTGPRSSQDRGLHTVARGPTEDQTLCTSDRLEGPWRAESTLSTRSRLPAKRIDDPDGTGSRPISPGRAAAEAAGAGTSQHEATGPSSHPVREDLFVGDPRGRGHGDAMRSRAGRADRTPRRSPRAASRRPRSMAPVAPAEAIGEAHARRGTRPARRPGREARCWGWTRRRKREGPGRWPGLGSS